MNSLYIVPSWFAGFDSVLELLFGLVTLVIAFYSYRIYRLSGQRETKLFALAFLSMAFSYLLWPVLNFFEVIDYRFLIHFLAYGSGAYVLWILLYAHALLFVLGAATLVYIALGFKSQRVYTLVVSLSLLVVVLSKQPAIAFPFVSALLLFYVCVHYCSEYFKARSEIRGLVLWSFSLIFLGMVQFVFATMHHMPYVIGHILTFTGYLLLCFALIKTIKR